MRKLIYSFVVCLLTIIQAQSQTLIPFSGSNTVNTNTTLCTHAGCGVPYSNNASGFTVLAAQTGFAISINGTYSTDSCCDKIVIYSGVGTSGSLLGVYSGQGTISFTGTSGQGLTVQFISNGSVVDSGLQAIVTYQQAANQNYCSPQNGTTLHGNNISNGLQSATISNTTFNVTTGLSLNGQGYTQIQPNPSSNTATLYSDSSYTFSGSFLGIQSVAQASIWIDWNQSGTFEASEYQTITLSGGFGNQQTGTSVITVPPTALAGQTGMRIRVRAAAFAATDACTLFGSGETEDYFITVVIPPCSGTPTSGTVKASSEVICANGQVVMSTTGNSYGPGITYQWQSSANGTSGWTNIANASNTTYTVSGITSTTYYRLITTCINPGGGSDTSSGVSVYRSATCYCSPLTGTTLHNTQASDFLAAATIQNTSFAAATGLGLSGTGYSFVPPILANNTGSVVVGNTYAFSGVCNSVPTKAAIWVDWNQNGTFDTTEFTDLTISGLSVSGNLVVPANAVSGITGMRIRLRGQSFNATNACSSLGTGETEDYLIQVLSSPTIPTITNLTASNNYCQGSTVTVAFSAAGYNAANTFTAQLSNSAGSFTSPVNIGTVSGGFGGTITATIPVGQAAGTGYRIRVVSSSPVNTGSANNANLTVNALPTAAQIAVTPTTNPSVCNGAAATLSVPATTGFTYQWLDNGLPIAGATSNMYMATVADTFSVRVTTNAGCQALSANRVVSLLPVPVATMTPDTAQTICAGQSVTFTTSPSTGVTYQWTLNNVNITNATSGSYTASAAGVYRVRVVNASGCADTTDPVTVTVSTAPTATISPSTTQAICPGNAVAFTATAGAGFTYQWRLNGSPISGATSAAYSANAAGTYSVVVTNANGCSATSTNVVVNLNTSPVATITPTTTQLICPGNTVTFTANTGTGLTYQWRRNGTAITGATASTFAASTTGSYTVTVTNTSGCATTSSATTVDTASNCPVGPTITSIAPATVICAGSQVTINFTAANFNAANVFTAQLSNSTGSFTTPVTLGTLSGATGGTITATISATQAAGTGYRIRIIASNPVVTGISNSTNLTIGAKPTAAQTAITPTGSQSICPGTVLTFSAPADPTLTFQWLLGGSPIAGATSNSYSTSAAGTYALVATTSLGCTTTSSNRTVALLSAPAATVTPSTAQTVCPGNTVTLAANTGTGLTYQWRLNGATVAGATAATYAASSAGTYSVTVTSTNGCSTTSNVVTVNQGTAAVATITPGTNQTFCPGNSLTLTADTGTGLTYQWRRNGVNITGATSQSYTATDTGSYVVVVTNSSGCTATSAATGISFASNCPTIPTITSLNPATTFCPGTQVTINFTAANYSTTNVFTAQLSSSSGSFTSPVVLGTITGATGGTITGTIPTSQSAGTAYRIRIIASNPAIIGATNSTNLTIGVRPTSTQLAVTPTGTQSICPGGTVNFSVPADTTLTYQWTLGGTPISGATSNSYAATGAGSYAVTATTVLGCSASSSNRTVSLLSLPTATITPSATQTLCPGNTITVSANTGTGLTYQWLLNGSAISGATASTYAVSAAGSYSVVVTNSSGCSKTSSSVTVNQGVAAIASITPSTPQTICPGNTIALTATAAAGQTYQWRRNGTNITGATSTSYTASDTGSYVVVVTSTSGCIATSPATAITPSTTCVSGPTITSLSPATTFCQGGQVVINFSAAFFDTTNIFTAQLSNSSGSFTTPVTIGTKAGTSGGSITATIPTTQLIGTGYRIRIVASNPSLTSANNGTNLTINAAPSSSSVNITPATAQSICSGSSVTFSVPTDTTLTFQWRLNGNAIAGATANSYTANAVGTYTVVATTASGCSIVSSNRTVTILANPTASITPNTTQLFTGSPITLQANTGTGLTYQWRLGGTAISGATNSSYSATVVGVYSVVVTNANGCFATSGNVTIQQAPTGATITSTGTRVKCAGDTIQLAYTAFGVNTGNVFTLQMSGPTGSFTASQVIGSVTSTTSGIITGTIPVTAAAGTAYRFRITGSNPVTTGGVSPLIMNLRGQLTDTVSLCAVTVDSATGKNKLVWNKPTSTNIDSFVVYRKSISGSGYARVAAQAYTAFSTWNDTASQPTVRLSRYYITAKNACFESPMSSVHKTMHLSISAGQNANTWNLIWNGYEGFTHSYYNIWRGTSPANMTLLTTTEALPFNSYTDFNAPSGVVYYSVSVGDGPVCNPTLRTTGEGMMVMSNIATNALGGALAEWADMSIYPNPSQSGASILIQSNQTAASYEVRVLDLSGRVLQTHVVEAGKSLSFGEELAQGVYTIEATKDGRRMIQKWIKQ